MKTQTKRTVVRAATIRSVEDITAIEVSEMVKGYEAKITSMYCSIMFDPFYQVWRKNGIQPMTREEVLRRCSE